MKISAALFVGAAFCALAISGCDYSLRQDMANQPYNRPLSPSDFFADGRSELPVNEKLLQRGQDRYKIFCAPCHGLQGDGNGMAAVRGMKHPPSYHIDRLRQAPNGYFYDVMTNGFGAMYSYSERIPPSDRWAIIAYVRALQLSRNAQTSDLPESLRQKLANSAESSGGTKE